MDSIKSHFLHFRRSLKTVSFYTRPFYTLWQVNQYIFAWNVAAFNEIVTRNVFIALSPYFWNRSKRSNEGGKGHHPPGGRYITRNERGSTSYWVGNRHREAGATWLIIAVPLRCRLVYLCTLSRLSFLTRRRDHRSGLAYDSRAFCEYGNQCVESRPTSVFTLSDTPHGER